MKPSLSLLALLVSALVYVAAAQTPDTYDARLSQARAYAAEKSWALAREAYTAAIPLAPDGETRRWCELWSLDAALRAATPFNRENETLAKAHAALLAPYEQGAPRDDFWLALIEARAEGLRRRTFIGGRTLTHWDDVLLASDELGQRPASPENAARYTKFLLHHLEEIFDPSPFLRTVVPHHRLLVHLRAAGESPVTASDKVWLKLYVATIGARSGMSAAAIEETLAAAETLAPTTPAAAAARATAFAWRARAGRLKADAKGFPDVSVWLVQLQSALKDLQGMPENAIVRQARKDLELLLVDWHTPRLNVATATTYRADETVAFGVGSAFIARLHFSVVRLAPGTWPEGFAFPPPSPVVLPANAEVIATWSVNTDSAPLPAWQTRMEAVPAPLPPGVYAVTVHSDEFAPIVRIFTVSSAAALAVHTPQGTEYLVYDNHTAEPWVSRPVTVGDHTGQALAAAATPPLVTDEDGRTPPAANLAPDPQRPQWIVVDGHPVRLPQRSKYDRIGYGTAPFQLDLFTDRALFRPGETVRWKLIARNLDDGRFRMPEKPFTLDVLQNGEPLIPQQTLTWSKLGTAHGSIIIPTDARPGKVSLELNRKPDNVDSSIPFSRPAAFVRGPAPDRSETGTHSVEFFTIDRFRPPPARATLDLASEPTSLRPGGTATFRIRAEYFSGGPVADAPVSFTLQAVTQLFNEAKPHSLELRQWRDSLQSPRTTVTDARGVATVTVDIPSFAPERLPFFVAASVTLHGAAAISANRLMAISRTGLHLEMDRSNIRHHDYHGREWVLPGETVRYRYRLVDPFGTPIDSESEAILHEQRWREIWLDAEGNAIANEELRLARLRHGSAPDALYKLGWTRLVGEIVESTAASATPVPDEDGWRTVAITLPRAGVFELRIHTPDGEVHFMSDPRDGLYLPPIRLIAADEQTVSLALRPNEAFLLHRAPDSAGQPPRFLAVFDEGIRHGLLAVTTSKNVHTFHLPPAQRIRVVALPPTDIPPEGVFARLVHPDEDFNAETHFSTSGGAHRIETSLEKLSQVDQPGAVSAWRLTTRDAKGRPVKAEVAVAVSDEAVNRLLPRAPASPRFAVNTSFKHLSYHSSPLWNPASAVLETRDPRLGLGAYRTAQIATAPTEGIRSLVLALGNVAATEEAPGYGSAWAGSSASSRHAPTAAEQALGQQNAPETEDELSSPKITIRRHFVSTAFWEPALETDEQGEARVSFTYPDNLTEWRLSAYSVGQDGQTFGTATAVTPSSLPFQARLLTPRYLIAGDAGSVAATLIDRTGQTAVAKAALSVDGSALRLEAGAPAHRELPLTGLGEARLRWPVQASVPGETLVTLRAKTASADDAMQLLLPVLEDGAVQRTSASALLQREQSTAHLRFTLPEPFDPQRTEVSVYLAPNRTRAVLDALPYLIDYPYGCVEQTVSRFLPAIIAQKTLTELGVSAEDVERYILHHERPADTRRRHRTAGLQRVSEVVNASLRRLEDLRNDSGLFGWWDHRSPSDSWMTAYALLGLAMAKSEGYKIDDDQFKETVDVLTRMLASAKTVSSADTFALAMLSLAADVTNDAGLRTRFETLYAARDVLGPEGRATLLLASTTFGTAEQRAILLRNLENGAIRASDDAYGDTVHWGKAAGYWRAEEGAVESTALTLLALREVAPEHPDIDAAVHWLVLNRRAGRWTNTRDTALAVLALSRTLTRTRDEPPELEVDVFLNGKPYRNLKIDRTALLSPTLTLSLPPSELKAGENVIELRRIRGEGPLYATALASSWARGDSVRPTGHLAAVNRSFVRQASRPTLMGTLQITPTPLDAQNAAAAGERVTAHVRMSMPHALDYVMVEVPKPAGCEPVNPLSGWDARLVKVDPADASTAASLPAHEGLPVYREEHDDKSVFFLHHVPAGEWNLRFDLRAIHPGDYRALPVHVEAMYVPEVRANSDSRRIRISE